MTLTDTLSDGLCPIVPAGVPVTGTWPDECPEPGGVSTVVGGTMISAEALGDGTFVVAFSVPEESLDPDQDVAISYDAYMREAYSTGERVSSGDTVSNAVDVNGATTPADGNTVDVGEVESENGSSQALETSGLSMTKSVWDNTVRTPITGISGAGQTCETGTPYVVEGGPLLQLGDLACFRIAVDSV